MKLNDEWTVEVVGRMHRCRITLVRLSEKCGCTSSYLSQILNCRKNVSQKTREVILKALEETENDILKEL